MILTISYDIRDPLTIIDGNAELVLELLPQKE